jgi:hypothetical protein
MDDAADPADSPDPAALPSRRFEGRDDFQQLVRDALACAAREGWRELILSDAGFEDWPLGERAVVESLQAWSRTGRRIVLLAKNYEALSRRCARFVAWRRTWSHIVDARACAAADALELPSAIWSPHWVLERRDLERSIGYCGREAQRRLLLHENLREWLQKSAPSFPATTLGL